ncbi:unnamed protein product [Adineta steineri]|uniref:Uncharacterized protein n=1 Tax=Adineta steineri TaxID=433720 RepID=A0A819B228_9BILA|nr:unnamed protein product [Adineta steineri]
MSDDSDTVAIELEVGLDGFVAFVYNNIKENYFQFSFLSLVFYGMLFVDLEIRFHISNHFFLCTSEQINEHVIIYLIGENIPYDNQTKEYLWNQTIAKKKDKQYYNIKCLSEIHNSACQNFTQQISGYCEGANEKNGYSILKRQFLLIVDRFKPLNLYYSACCWPNSSFKNFYFNLSIETDLTRINSSPYPYIPASYYVAFNKSNTIQIFAFDIDGDEILCAPYQEDTSGFLTVFVDNDCKLKYKIDQSGKQFGQFWLMDRFQNRILSRTLISIQIHVLDNLICDNQPELIVQNKDHHTNKSIMNLNQLIHISVRLHPNCVSIQPQDQTINEITTLCTNNQPIILANGGIEVIFQCRLNLCETYHICFIGEIGLKLPATNIQCHPIQVIGSKSECIKAANEYNYSQPHNRHFNITKPIEIKSSARSQSRKWLSIFLAHLAFLFVGIIAYCSCKQMLLLFYNRSFRKRSSRKRSRTMSETSPIVIRHSTKSMEPLLHKHENIPSKKEKYRTQHLRLGSVDHPNKQI